MSRVLRWGRSAYEIDSALAFERQGAERLGLSWALREDRSPPEEFDAEILVVPSRVRIDERVARDFGGKLIVATTSGYDHIDLEACRRHGIAVVRMPQARRDAVVEQAVAHLIALRRRLPVLEQRARNDRWARGELPALAPRGIRGATVAVVGVGVIGRRMVEVLGALGAHVIGVDPAGVDSCEAADLDEALHRADAVTLHCSLGATSGDLLSRERIARMKPGAVLVNTARGDVLDLPAAIEAVRVGHLGGLATDVFPVEPYPALAAGASLPDVLFTPHSAGYTDDLGGRVAQGVVEALDAWVSGRPLPYRLV